MEAIEALIKLFFRNCDDRQKSLLKALVLKILIANNLPTFDTLLDSEYPEEVELFEDDSE